MMWLSLLSLAFAEQPEKSLTSGGELRLLGTLPPNLIVDSEGTEVGQGLVMSSRLRAALHIDRSTWKFTFGGDVLSGQFAGDPWDLAGDIHRLHPETIGLTNPHNYVLRDAKITSQFGPIQWQMGLTTTHWGLGLVANDGTKKLDFGTTDYGDRVFRTSISTKPGDAVSVYFAGDWVIEDDLGAWSEGQRGLQGTVGVLWGPENAGKMGFLGVYRDQIEADKISGFSGFLLDVFATTTQKVNDFAVTTGFEGAYMRGATTRFTNRNNPQGLKIRSFGALSKTTVSYQEKTNLSFAAGFASGDGDPSDATLSTFSFDRDCNAGALLFDYHQAAREVALYNLLTDPEHSGQPPDGVDSAVTEGAIRQATYVNPIFGYRIISWMEMKAGAVFAWSTAPISHGFETYRNGGVAVNHLGESTNGYFMGTEINWAVVVASQLPKTTTGQLTIEGAHLLPSVDLGGDSPLSLLRLQAFWGW